MEKKHVIVARVDNRPGVVSRISGLFTRRGYNIESLVTGMTSDPSVYHLTVSLYGTEEEVQLLLRQLCRFVDVREAREVPASDSVIHELMYLRIACAGEARAEVIKIAEALSLRVAGIGERHVIIEATGDEVHLESARRALEPFGLEDVIRSGSMAVLLD